MIILPSHNHEYNIDAGYISATTSDATGTGGLIAKIKTNNGAADPEGFMYPLNQEFTLADYGTNPAELYKTSPYTGVYFGIFIHGVFPIM